MTDESELVGTVLDLLTALDRGSVPAAEILVIDTVASWLVSDENPASGGDPAPGYEQDHAGQVLSMVLGALGEARAVDLDRAPADTGSIGVARDRLVAGAHELAERGEQGVQLVLARAVPAILGELTDHAGQVGDQLRSAYVFPLFAIATGTADQGDEAVMRGLTESFAAWDAQIGEGWVVPWRRA